MKGFIAWFILGSLLAGCGWDTDEEFLPEWETTWLVVEQQGQGSLFQVTEESLELVNLPAPVSRLVNWQDHIWAATTTGTLYQLDPFSGAIIKTVSIPNGTANDVGDGLDYLYVTSSPSTLYLFDGKEEWKSRSLPGRPGLVQARSDRAFVVIDDSVIWKVQEQSILPRDSFRFSRPVLRLQNDNGVETFVTHQDTSALYLSRLNYHGQAFRFFERRQQVDDILFNPLLRAETNKEYLGNLEINDGCLVAFPNICGNEFRPVWEEAKILVHRSDSLFLYSLTDGLLLHEYGGLEGTITDGENVIR